MAEGHSSELFTIHYRVQQATDPACPEIPVARQRPGRSALSKSVPSGKMADLGPGLTVPTARASKGVCKRGT